MNRLLVVAAVLVICAITLEAGPTTTKKPRRQFPPNSHKPVKHPHKLPAFVQSNRHRAAVAIPSSFDARTKWPQCKSISDIRNQGQCGTCWAVSSASVISDRLCIVTGSQDYVSAEQIASCTDETQSAMDNCDAGGDPSHAYQQATLFGVATGGSYGSKSGCIPYSVAPGAKIPLTCPKTCTNKAYAKTPVQDAHFVDSYWATYIGDSPTAEQIKNNIAQMQLDIMTNGPITAAITCWTDFQDWGADDEPYEGPSRTAKNEGGHAIRVVGWGVSKKGKNFWWIANSWGTDVGDKGFYKILMGKNTVGIEGTISAPIIKLPNTCGPFCDAPIDQIIRTNPADMRSPVFAFQGNCSVQVKISADGKMSQVGAPAPIAKNFVGGPAGPITKWMNNGKETWFMNPSGAAGACAPVTGATKQKCSSGSASSGAGPQTVGSGGNKYIYYNEAGKNQYMFTFKGGSNSGSGAPIGAVITEKFTTVNYLISTGTGNIVVGGTDKSGNAIQGVMAEGTFKWVTAPGPLKNTLTC